MKFFGWTVIGSDVFELVSPQRGGRCLFEFTVNGSSTFQLTGGAAVMEDEVDHEHEDEDAAESHNDGGARGGVKLNTEEAA